MLKRPVSASRGPRIASFRRCLSGPRNHRVQRNGKTHLRPIHDLARQVRLHGPLEQNLALLAADLERGRQAGQPLDERMVHQRLAHLQRVRHAGPVDLGIDVADQIGLEVEVLDERDGIVGTRATRRGGGRPPPPSSPQAAP